MTHSPPPDMNRHFTEQKGARQGSFQIITFSDTV